MFDFHVEKRTKRHPFLVGSYFVVSTFATIWAGAEIPWNPAISIAIFVAFGVSIPFIIKYGMKGEDPRVAIEKGKDFFTRGLPHKPKSGEEVASPKPAKKPSESPITPTTTSTKEYKGYKERFNMVKDK